MEFTVFHKTGELRDAQGDWDGDDGYETSLYVSDGEVESYIKEIIIGEYFDKKNNYEGYRQAYKMLTDLFNELDIFDELTELFEQELQDRAQWLYDQE